MQVIKKSESLNELRVSYAGKTYAYQSHKFNSGSTPEPIFTKTCDIPKMIMDADHDEPKVYVTNDSENHSKNLMDAVYHIKYTAHSGHDGNKVTGYVESFTVTFEEVPSVEALILTITPLRERIVSLEAECSTLRARFNAQMPPVVSVIRVIEREWKDPNGAIVGYRNYGITIRPGLEEIWRTDHHDTHCRHIRRRGGHSGPFRDEYEKQIGSELYKILYEELPAAFCVVFDNYRYDTYGGSPISSHFGHPLQLVVIRGTYDSRPTHVPSQSIRTAIIGDIATKFVPSDPESGKFTYSRDSGSVTNLDVQSKVTESEPIEVAEHYARKFGFTAAWELVSDHNAAYLA